MNKSDTIVAIATPHGRGGIAVVRLSGSEALPMALSHLDTEALAPRHATYCHFDELDDGIVTYYPAPHSYTGEPTVEFSCHGSEYVQQAVVQALVDSGARLAEPGEYTLRAFLNGRLNLSQVEAVADLIDATTPTQHRLAVSQLRGGYAQQLADMRTQLLDITSLLELELDFSDEDVEFADRSQLKQLVDSLEARVGQLRDTFRQGNALKRGIPVAIAGCPNVGKSTLLNALLQDHRALVSDMPGTTRDTIEETFMVDGITFRLIDTAGLRHSDDPLEAMGIERTLDAVAKADIVIYVHDATKPAAQAQADMRELQERIPLGNKHVITVANKTDLPNTDCVEQAIALSAKEGTGLGQLTQALTEAAATSSTPDVLLTNERHYEALGRVGQALHQVGEGLKRGTTADLVAVDLRDALYHLGTITGEVTNDEVLGNIFSRFCIGK